RHGSGQTAAGVAVAGAVDRLAGGGHRPFRAASVPGPAEGVALALERNLPSESFDGHEERTCWRCALVIFARRLCTLPERLAQQREAFGHPRAWVFLAFEL